MECIIKPYKVVWTQGNRASSAMYDTLDEAKAAAKIIIDPKMIMKLSESDGGNYVWEILPSYWAFLARHYIEIVIAAVVLSISLGYLLRSTKTEKPAKS